MKKGLLLFGILLHYYYAVFSQNTIGIPSVINHTRQEYHAGSQNWDARQDANGIMYFANNDGLLSYDGNFWRLYPLPNKVIARSLAIAADGRIYVGGQEEFGYFSPGAGGELVYTSLKPLIPQKDNDFADVWDICIFKKDVFFRSNKRIFILSGNTLTAYKSTNWVFLGNTPDQVIACEYDKGMVSFQDGAWQPIVHTGSLPPRAKVSAVLPIGSDSLLISSFSSGLFILHHDTLSNFESPAINALVSENIAGVTLLAPDRIALITNLAGCIVINKKGELIQQFLKQQGLQNNNILCSLLDKDKNLWLGLDNGVDMISYNNAITNISPEKEDRNAGYTSRIYNNRLYLGLSTGVYSARLDGDSGSDLSLVKSSFEFVENTKGQAWNLDEVNGKLLVAHNNGAFVISGNKAVPFDNKTGFWTFFPLYTTSPSPIMIAGTYNGINVYNEAKGTFTNPRIHAQFESAKFVALDGRTIWIAHSYKGLYKVVFNENDEPMASAYHDKSGMLSANHNHLFKIKDKIILTTDNGIFEYDHKLGDFVRSTYYEAIFEHTPVTYLKEDAYGNTWFCRDKKMGVIDMSSGKPRTVYISELDNKITSGGYENINIIDSNNVIVAAEKGFFHLNYAQYAKAKYPVRVLIRNVHSTTLRNGLLFGGYRADTAVSETLSIPYQGNSLHFEFSCTLYGQEQNIDYSYYLRGFDKGWSEWSKKPEKDYTNLPYGDYVFMVKGRNSLDNESPVASYSFSILPPWYQTWWAYTLYGLLICALLYLFYKRQQHKYKRLQLVKLREQQRQYDEEQKQLQFLHQLEISKNEREIVQLKNDKLQAEVDQKKTEIEGKNRELASNAMSFVQKGELLSGIKEELIRLRHNAELEKESKDFKRIIRIIDNELDNVHDWEQFAVHFDSVHTDFLKNLKERVPDLTASELKLCAYLRLNLSTKEISQLMNISIRGVETSRYRLRKKLGLPNDANLVDYLLSITH